MLTINWFQVFLFNICNSVYLLILCIIDNLLTAAWFWNFDIQMYHLIPARQPDLMIIYIKERTCRIVYFAVLAYQRVKLGEYEKRDKYLTLLGNLKRTVEQENDGISNCNWCSLYSHQKIDTRTGGLANKRRRREHPNYCFVESD